MIIMIQKSNTQKYVININVPSNFFSLYTGVSERRLILGLSKSLIDIPVLICLAGTAESRQRPCMVRMRIWWILPDLSVQPGRTAAQPQQSCQESHGEAQTPPPP